jgi:hypothetical protein
MVLAFKGDPNDSYQTWKFISYMLPCIYTIMLTFIIRQGVIGKILIIFLLFVGLLSPIRQWTNSINLDDLAVSHEMENTADNPLILNQKNLNLDLRPYYESMAMAVVLQAPQIYINSPQYFPLKQNPDACTLIRRDNLKYLLSKPINSTYALVPSQTSKCALTGLKISYLPTAYGKTIYFSKGSEGTKSLISGWSTPESWGTWSDGNNATIGIVLPQLKKTEITLKINGSAHIPMKSEILEVKYFVNGKKVQDKNFVKENISSETILKFPSTLVDKDSVVLLEFRIKNATSPKNDGISQDPRKIGFGISSLEVENE